MDMQTIKAAIELGKTAVSDIMTLTAQNDLADAALISLVRAAANTMRREMQIRLRESGLTQSPEGGELVIDSSKSAIAAADYAEARWNEYADNCYRYLDAYERLKPSAEGLRNLNQANEFVALLEGAAKALVAANARAHREAHPQSTTGLGDIRIGEPAYVSVIVGKLDVILQRLEPRAQVAGPERLAAADESTVLDLLRRILALLLAKEGTGEPPVVVSEGIVGEFIEYKPWHSTAGTGGIMYGTPGQPKLLLGNWQYDALYRCTQSGTFITVAVPGGVAKHITVLPDATFWLSVATGEIPKAPIPVVLSDLDANGNRVVQRLHV